MAAIRTIPAVDYYYDSHTDEEDLLGQSDLHFLVIRYLVDVLEWMFRAEGWFITSDLNLYRTANRMEKPTVPDVAVFIGVVRANLPLRQIKSWPVTPPLNPPPAVVFEIGSDDHWEDLNTKPAKYTLLGVEEYYFYDPRPEPEALQPRLRGWKRREGSSVAMAPDERGWIWSEELSSWLVPHGERIHLYDSQLNIRLTAAEAERSRAEAERSRAEAERARADAERALRERLFERLRERGIDPEELLGIE